MYMRKRGLETKAGISWDTEVMLDYHGLAETVLELLTAKPQGVSSSNVSTIEH